MSIMFAPPPAPPRDDSGDGFGREPEPDPRHRRRERRGPWDFSDLVNTVGISAPVYQPGYGCPRRSR